MKKISACFFAAAFVFSAAFTFTSMSKNNDSLYKDNSERKTEKSSAYGNASRKSENSDTKNGSAENAPSISSAEGTILYQGNVPFQYPCIKTPDGKTYTILAEEKTMRKIEKNASSFFRFEGRIIPNEPGKLSYKGSKDGYFEVRNFEILGQF